MAREDWTSSLQFTPGDAPVKVFAFHENLLVCSGASSGDVTPKIAGQSHD